jgi:hypothetical protein
VVVLVVAFVVPDSNWRKAGVGRVGRCRRSTSVGCVGCVGCLLVFVGVCLYLHDECNAHCVWMFVCQFGQVSVVRREDATLVFSRCDGHCRGWVVWVPIVGLVHVSRHDEQPCVGGGGGGVWDDAGTRSNIAPHRKMFIGCL